MIARRLLVPVVVLVVVVVAVIAAVVWFLRGAPDETRNTSGFAPPEVTQASFCAGVDGFRADVAAADPQGSSTAYADQVHRAAQRLRSAGTPVDMPSDARTGLRDHLGRLLALPTDATPADVDRAAAAGDTAQRQSLTTYLASECPSS